MITPEQVERRLYDLSREVDDAQEELMVAERMYHERKAKYEIAIAEARLRRQGITGLRVQDIADRALLDVRDEFTALHAAEAVAKAARGNVQRIRTQVDIARSIGTSVRTSMDT